MSQEHRIEFHYKKSSLFRVVHADGAWGGLTPELNLFFTFFNTRPPIPEMLVQEVTEDGHLGGEIEDLKVCKTGLVREVEVGIVMTPENIKGLIQFLQRLQSKSEQMKRDSESNKEPAPK